MGTYQTIVVVHPGAIGDAVMGTPVPLLLRQNFPQATIVYLTHPSLFPLLELCGAIDLFAEWQRKMPLGDLVAQINQHKPDLVIDLVGSLRTRLVCLLSRGRTLTYRKQRNPATWQHVVDNYLETLAPLQLKPRQPLFPTLLPPAPLLDEIRQDERFSQPCIALVPGVGKHRPNRAWLSASWSELGKRLHALTGKHIVLIGGEDDDAVCREVAASLGAIGSNMCGRLSLTQTTALLSQMDFVVSADTGPAHIACAVGRPVICLMGPTDPLRTGPYRMEALGIYRGQQCHCRMAKQCRFNDGGPGKCMQSITVEDVLSAIEAAGISLTKAESLRLPGR
jgi:ADP-heptose:LPS heptosyltransferase